MSEPRKKKKGINDFLEMKKLGQKITFLTAYDYPTAALAEQAGLDILLVGDSLGMCVYGYEGTLPVTMTQMLLHSEAVRRGAHNTFIVGDMPFMSYQRSIEDAVYNAGRFFKKAGIDAVKLEGGKKVCDRIRAIVEAGMLVMGHIGLTPQSSGQMGGFKAQGRTLEAAEALIDDAKAIRAAGAFSLLLEAVPPEVSSYIARNLTIPTLGIGAGPGVDGQLLIVNDLLGVFQPFTPKFVKRYGEIGENILKAMGEYVAEVRGGLFPTPSHCYNMIEGEKERFEEMIKRPE